MLAAITSDSVRDGLLWIGLPLNYIVQTGIGMVMWRIKRDAGLIRTSETRIQAAALEAIEIKHRASVALADQRHEAMLKLYDDRHALATKLIDERMQGITHMIRNHAQSVVTSLDTINAKLSDQDGAIEKLGQNNHEGELKFLQRIYELQLAIQRSAVSKDDLEKHETSMRREMGQLRDQVTNQVNKRTGH